SGRHATAGSDGLRARCGSGCANDRVSVGSKSALRLVPAPFFQDVREPDAPKRPHAAARLTPEPGICRRTEWQRARKLAAAGASGGPKPGGVVAIVATAPQPRTLSPRN